MKTILAILCGAAGAYGAVSSAHATVARPVLDPQALPTQCRTVAAVPADARTQLPLFEAETSAAACEAVVALEGAKGPPTEASVKALASAMAPSLALLDDTISKGDLESQIVATFAKANLLVGLDVYVAGNVSRVGTMTGSDLTEYRRQIDKAHALASPWRERGIAAFRDLNRLVHTPGGRELAGHNPVIMSIVSQATSAPTE